MQLISLSKNNEFFKNKYLSFTKTKIVEDGTLKMKENGTSVGMNRL